MSSFTDGDRTHATTSHERQRALRAEILPGELSGTLASALEQAEEAMRRARTAMDAAHLVERRMRIMDDRLKAMAAASSSITWLSTGDGLMEDAPYWRQFTGQSADEVVGWGWLDATHPDDRARVIANWREALNQKLPYIDEYRIRRADGVYLDFLTQAAPIYEDDGSVREWLGVSVDITHRKRLEHDLQASERKYRETFEQAASGMAHVAPDGQILLANDQFCRLLGYERGELLTLNIATITHPDDLTKDIAHMADVLDGQSETYTMEKRFLRRDGGVIWANITGSLVRDSEDQPLHFIKVAEDINELKRLEHDLADNVAQLEAIFEAIGDAVFVYDEYGHPVRTNAATRDLYGVDPSQSYFALPREERRKRVPVYDMEGYPLPAEQRPAARALRGEVFHGDAAQDVRLRAVDGRLHDLSFTGAPIRRDNHIVGAVVVARDVTERRRLERVAHEAERQAAARASELEAALEAMTDGVALYDARGHLLRLNRAASLYLAPAGSAGHGPHTIATDADNLALPDAFISRLLSGRSFGEAGAALHEEMRCAGQDGRQRELSLTGVTIRADNAGAVAGAVVVARDVTERNRLERQRKDMLQMVGHDLSSPLQASRVYVQRRKRQLEERPEPDERETASLTALEHSLGRIERLVGDVQMAARIELGVLRLTRERINLTEVVRAERDLAATATGREIILEAPEGPVFVEGDAGRIGQALANLLGNAHKYSPRGCPIWLTFHVKHGVARIAVRDEGPGIPCGELDRIWEQFHQVKGIPPLAGQGGGLGLGLYIARYVIEAHGGEINVESSPGSGSTFWFTLPIITGAD